AGFRPALPSFGWDAATIGTVLAPANVLRAVLFGAYLMAAAAMGLVALGARLGAFLVAYPAVLALAWLSLSIEGSAAMQAWGFEYVIFGLLIGLFISNVIGLPAWLAEGVRTEYYIKTGLVLMGATILFGGILRAGIYGIVQALLVIVVVWYIAF